MVTGKQTNKQKTQDKTCKYSVTYSRFVAISVGKEKKILSDLSLESIIPDYHLKYMHILVNSFFKKYMFSF